MFFVELHSWAIAVTAIALFLLVEIALVVWVLLKQTQSRWLLIFMLLSLGISIWALLVARETFKTFDSLEGSVSAHGKGYFRILVEHSTLYTRTLFYCQLLLFLAVLAALLVAGIYFFHDYLYSAHIRRRRLDSSSGEIERTGPADHKS